MERLAHTITTTTATSVFTGKRYVHLIVWFPSAENDDLRLSYLGPDGTTYYFPSLRASGSATNGEVLNIVQLAIGAVIEDLSVSVIDGGTVYTLTA